MIIDQSVAEHLGTRESLFNFSVLGWKRRSAQASLNFDPKLLDNTKNLYTYRTADKADKWQYWPQEITGPNVRTVNTRAIITDGVRSTGQIRISTALLNEAQKSDFARDFESKVAQALNTSYTTERVIAKQPTDIISTNAETRTWCLQYAPRTPTIKSRSRTSSSSHRHTMKPLRLVPGQCTGAPRPYTLSVLSHWTARPPFPDSPNCLIVIRPSYPMHMPFCAPIPAASVLTWARTS